MNQNQAELGALLRENKWSITVDYDGLWAHAYVMAQPHPVSAMEEQIAQADHENPDQAIREAMQNALALMKPAADPNQNELFGASA